MYRRQIPADFSYTMENGPAGEPVATLADEWGGRCQICIDDHCYILRLKQESGLYRTTPYIFKEAFEVLKTLPSPK